MDFDHILAPFLPDPPLPSPPQLHVLFHFTFYLIKGVLCMSSGCPVAFEGYFPGESMWGLYIYRRNKTLLSLLTQVKGTQAPPPQALIAMAPCTLFLKKTPHLPNPIIFLRNLPLHSEKEALRPWGGGWNNWAWPWGHSWRCYALHWGSSSPR